MLSQIEITEITGTALVSYAEYNVILPTKDNDGNDQQETVTAIVNEIIALCGGCSTVIQTGYELYRETSKVYTDRAVRVLAIIRDEHIERAFNACLSSWCVQLHQNGLYAQRHLVEVNFTQSPEYIPTGV